MENALRTKPLEIKELCERHYPKAAIGHGCITVLLLASVQNVGLPDYLGSALGSHCPIQAMDHRHVPGSGVDGTTGPRWLW